MDKPLLRRLCNRVLHTLARHGPGSTSLRPRLHRARGVVIKADVFIGEDVYIDNEYPERIEIHERVQISVRAILIAHTRGPGQLIIGADAFVGPGAILICGAGKTLKIGEGAVIAAGSIITRSVPPGVYIAPEGPKVLARVGVPLSSAETMQQFWAGLTPIHAAQNPGKPAEPPAREP